MFISRFSRHQATLHVTNIADAAPYRYGDAQSLNMFYYSKDPRPTEASRGAKAQSVTVNTTGCGFDPHSRK